MMKPLFPVLLVALVALSAPAVSAQDDACSEADPCIWVVTVDETGLSSTEALAGTAGDWFVFEFNNVDADGADHVVTSSMDDASWSVANIDSVTSAPFELVDGSFTLSDDPTGDTLAFTGSLDDVTGDGGAAGTTGDGSGGGADSAGNGAPGVGFVATLAVLGAVVFARRR